MKSTLIVGLLSVAVCACGDKDAPQAAKPQQNAPRPASPSAIGSTKSSSLPYPKLESRAYDPSKATPEQLAARERMEQRLAEACDRGGGAKRAPRRGAGEASRPDERAADHPATRSRHQRRRSHCPSRSDWPLRAPLRRERYKQRRISRRFRAAGHDGHHPRTHGQRRRTGRRWRRRQTRSRPRPARGAELRVLQKLFSLRLAWSYDLCK